MPLETRAEPVGKWADHMGPGRHVWFTIQKPKAVGFIIRFVMINLKIYKV